MSETDVGLQGTGWTGGGWTVGEVAALTGVSIRALRHYDEIGLLRPAARSEGNYRLYTSADLARLHRLLTFRDLGFPLAEIARLLGGGPEREREALRLQVSLLRERQRRTQATLDAVEAFLRAAEQAPEEGEGRRSMTDDTIREVFGGFDPAVYEAEVQESWGDTDAYRQSAARTGRYTKADWAQVRAEGEALSARYLALMNAGIPAGSPQAAEVAQAHRAYFQKWFYDCSPGMLRAVSELWVTDERFTRNIDQARPGLAAYQHAAVQAWAQSME